jgi:hypothetical protein
VPPNLLVPQGIRTLTAADASAVVAGTTAARTVRTGTLDAIATAEPPVAAVAFNSQRASGLANATTLGDALAFGQAPLIFTAKSADYNPAASGDFVQMTGSHTVTLPAPSTAGRIVGVLSVNGTGAAPCTVSTPSGTILGPGVAAAATSFLLGTAGAYAIVQSDGTNWNIVAGQQDSGWIQPSLGNSWTGTTVQPTYRLLGTIVYNRGEYSPGGTSGTSPFTFPAGYRPAATVFVTAGGIIATTPSACLVQVSTAGVVTIYYAATTTNLGDGYSFSVV